jgi:hypothetical protein
MKLRLTIGIAALATALAVCGLASAALISIYRDPMESSSQRAQLVKLTGANCSRGGSRHALRVAFGKRTSECAYRTRVVGRDLEIAATERLLSGTPKSLQKQMYLSLGLRAGGGKKYQLAVYPLQRKVQLRKFTGGKSVKYLAIEKSVRSVAGLNMANQLRLRAFNVTSGADQGACHLLAWVGGKLVVDVVDPSGGELAGRASSVGAGAGKNARDALVSIDDVVVRVPSPF